MSNYTLIPKKGKEIFKITLIADMNDGDYLTTIREYTKDRFDLMIDEIKRAKDIVGEYDKLRDFQECYLSMPWDSQSGEPCHTLESIDIEYIDSEGRIFEVIV